jgi:hypothetical protein
MRKKPSIIKCFRKILILALLLGFLRIGRPRDIVLNIVQWLHRVAKNGPVILLGESKQSVDVTEKLLVIVTAIAMVIMVPSAASSKSERNDILRRPRKVKLNNKREKTTFSEKNPMLVDPMHGLITYATVQFRQ